MKCLMTAVAILTMIAVFSISVVAQKADLADKAFAAFEVYDAAFLAYSACLSGQSTDNSNKKPERDCTNLQNAWKKAGEVARATLEDAKKK